MKLVAPQGDFGTTLQEGSHDVRISGVKLEESRANKGLGLMWIVEYDVYRSTAPGEQGQARRWNQKRVQEDLGLAAVKAFLFAIFEAKGDRAEEERVNSVIDALTEYVPSPHNPLVGLYVHVDTAQTTTQGGKGFPFMKHGFSSFNYAAEGWPDQTATLEKILADASMYQPPMYAPQGGQNYGPPQGQQQNYGPPQQQYVPQASPQQNYGPPQGQQQNYGPPQQQGWWQQPQNGGWRR